MTSDALAERPDGALTTSAPAPPVVLGLTVSTTDARPSTSPSPAADASSADLSPAGGTSPSISPSPRTSPSTSSRADTSSAGVSPVGSAATTHSSTAGPTAGQAGDTGADAGNGSTTPVRTASAGTAWRVRPARPDDVGQIHYLVRELADYEREPDAVKAAPEDFGAAFFNPHPRVHCHVVEVDGPNGPMVVGLAIWYVTFSTWRGRHGLWLEDLYVQPAYRRLGVGRALLAELAAICTDRGYARMEWWVLDWNEPAHHFYRQVGAEPQDDWTVWRVTDAPLRALGSRPK